MLKIKQKIRQIPEAGGTNSAKDFPAAVIPRRNAVTPGEKTAENELVGKSRRFGDLSTGCIGVPEEIFGFGKTQVQQISARRNPEHLAEFLFEGRAGTMAGLRQFIQ